jgi:hypothetical protein
MKTKDALTLVIAAGGLAWGLIQYHVTSRSEFLKPYREVQIDLYRRASAAAAQLATLPPSDARWEAAKYDFLKLFYGPLCIVEDYRHGPSRDDRTVTVEEAMIAFKTCLDNEKCRSSNVMKDLSLGLAHTCRVSLGSSWGFHAAQLSGDYQKLIREYLERQEQQEKSK